MHRLAFAFASPVLWLFSGLALLGAHELFSAEKPLIAVRFKVEAQDYRDNLAKVLLNVESELTSDLVKHFNRRFSFYEWTSALKQKDPAKNAALLTVSLARGDRGAPNWNIFLVFAADIQKNGAAFDCSGNPKLPPPGPFLIPLYTGSEEQPTGKRVRLRDDVRRKMTDTAQDQALQKRFADGFFIHVPFCRNATLASRLIVIPLSKDALRAQEGSKMELDFCAQPRDERYRALGFIPLIVSERQRVDDKKFADFIQAVPGLPQFSGLSKDYDVQVLFSYAIKPSLGLFMVEFNQGQPNTSPTHVITSTP